ncbi:hypothetical protein AGMMS49593_09130 [Endomicrobiia bacterium]|nr:hypothetical protein AGMMS49593_09130 [Endomicrobiia bacterium]
MQIYDLGCIKLHAYQTNNPINDELFAFEKMVKLLFLKLLTNNTLTIARIKMAFIETNEGFD